MAHFFIAGGWGMYPTLLCGFFMVASGVLLVLRPERRQVSLVLSLGVATVGSGLLSFSLGLANTFRFLGQVPPAEQIKVAALGAEESLHSVVLALLLVLLTALLASIGSLRMARSVPLGASAP